MDNNDLKKLCKRAWGKGYDECDAEWRQKRVGPIGFYDWWEANNPEKADRESAYNAHSEREHEGQNFAQPMKDVDFDLPF